MSFESGALFDISGTVAINATWSEDIYFSEAGAPMDISDLEWRMTFRRCDDVSGWRGYGWGWASESPTLTLSTDDALSVVEDDNGYMRILRIDDAAGFIDCSGDFVCDLASKDVNGKITAWGHGLVTFRNNPVTWS